jgi:predicted transcriptional regulator
MMTLAEKNDAEYRRWLEKRGFWDGTLLDYEVQCLLASENWKREEELRLGRQLMRWQYANDPAKKMAGGKRSELTEIILEALSDKRSHSLEELEQLTGSDREQLRFRLKNLKQSGRVRCSSYGHWQMSERLPVRAGDSVPAVRSMLNGTPLKVKEISQVTGVSYAYVHRILAQLASAGEARKTPEGWLSA